MKRLFTSLITGALLTSCLYCSAEQVRYQVLGLKNGEKATVSLGSTSFLHTQTVTADGKYTFEDVPEGEHSLKITARGYEIPDSKLIQIIPGVIHPNPQWDLVVKPIDFSPNHWQHEWTQDNSVEGKVSSSHIFTESEIKFLGKEIVPADVSYFGLLKQQYNVVLSDELDDWSEEHAYRLVETFKTLPVNYDIPAKFLLTSDHLYEDMTIEKYEGGQIVTISKDAFVYANPFIVDLEGVRGKFFSKRLHHALVRFVTDSGEDRWKVEQILNDRFGCSMMIPDYAALTSGTTQEDMESFQDFRPSEIFTIINMFEEMPEGFHSTPHLNYLVRRRDDLPNPLYPLASTVSWRVDDGYIEFMNHSRAPLFDGNNEDTRTRLEILKGKALFLWEYLFPESLKNDWTATCSDSADPAEDMAESIAAYLKSPGELLELSADKYNFIRDHIMHGTRYLSAIPDHLTFEVLNLWPEYEFPGKIKRVNISVDGAPEDQKTVTMEIELNHDQANRFETSGASVRMFSPEYTDQNGNPQSQFVDLRMEPEGDNSILRGRANVSQYAKSGLWSCSQIILADSDGIERFDQTNDCVTNLYINNSSEDTVSPTYVPGSLEYELSDGIEEGHPVKILNVSFEAHDNNGIWDTFARISNDYEGWSGGGGGLTDVYGTFNKETGRAEIRCVIPEFCPSANYFVDFISFTDLAGSPCTVFFSDLPEDEPVKKIYIETSTPDYEAPEIDLNRISVYAEPTHPEAPDGETIVTVNFYGRDNISGIGPVDYQLCDPQGTVIGTYWFYHQHHSGLFFEGDPTVWEHYTITHILPPGSAPGIWGLNQMSLVDKAGNVRIYNFVETIIFEPYDSDDYKLEAEFMNLNTLRISLSHDGNPLDRFFYRIIHEDSGKEINGEYVVNSGVIHPGGTSSDTDDPLKIDVSDLDDGKLLVITTVKDEDNRPVAIKSKALTKVNDILTGVLKSHGDRNIHVTGENQKFHISGADPAETVRIYSIAGELLFTGTADALGEKIFANDIYIITLDNFTAKIFLK